MSLNIVDHFKCYIIKHTMNILKYKYTFSYILLILRKNKKGIFILWGHKVIGAQGSLSLYSELILSGLRGPYGVLRIKSGSVTSKANVLSCEISL